jgi:adenylate kinase
MPSIARPEKLAACRPPEHVIVLLFGPPGCGKGTQASLISSRYPIPAISTGEIFRAECRMGTPLGKRACSILASGGLVDDEIVNRMVANRLSQPDCIGGFLLDGYPRTVPQARFLDHLLRQKGLPKPAVIHLAVRPDMLVERLSMRRQCPACSKIYNLASQPPRTPEVCDVDGAPLVRRPDDDEAIIRERLKAYEEATRPVIAHYRGARYHLLNGERPPSEIFRGIERVLAPLPPRSGRLRRVPAPVRALSTCS